VLFIHEVDWQKKVAFDLHELAESLSIIGHKVYVIDFEDSWKRTKLLDLGSLATNEYRGVHRIYNNASITLKRPGFIKLPILDRLSAIITHYYEIEKTVKEKEIDVIVLYSVPTNGLQAIKIAKKYNIPIVFRSIDVLYMLVRNRILRRITHGLEKKVYSNVDKILALTPKLADYVVNEGADKSCVDLLLFGVDTKEFNPNVDTNLLRKYLGISDKDKVIIFMGTLFEFSGLDRYIEQFPGIIKEIPEAKLVIVGGGYLFDKLKRIRTNLGIDNKIILTGFQKFEMMPQYINLAHLCINPFLINNTTRDIIPGKIYQYLACAKPVLATPLEGMKSLISGENGGVFYSDIDNFGKKTVDLLKDAQLLKDIGKNGHIFCLENNDRYKIVHKLEIYLEAAAKNG
jgi:glycosyltransferase involved in cell wall biosynthesis